MAEFRAKAYANRHDKAEGKVGHLQVSGTVEAFVALVKGKASAKEAFEQAVTEELKKS